MNKKLERKIRQTFPKIKACFNSEELKEFSEISENDLCLYHFGLGTWIRNRLLNPESCLYNQFVLEGVTHKDEMSSIMIRAFYKEIKKNN